MRPTGWPKNDTGTHPLRIPHVTCLIEGNTNRKRKGSHKSYKHREIAEDVLKNFPTCTENFFPLEEGG